MTTGGVVAFTATIILIAHANAADRSQEFAAEELRRYLSELAAVGEVAVDVSIDPSVGGGHQAFSVDIQKDQIKIVGSSGNLALEGTYWLLDKWGCRFLAPAFTFYHG